MPKKLNKKLDKAFISTKITTDKTIRDAAYRNIRIVENIDIKNIHLRVIKIMGVKSDQDSKYFNFDEFNCLLKEARVLTKRTAGDHNEFELL